MPGGTINAGITVGIVTAYKNGDGIKHKVEVMVRLFNKLTNSLKIKRFYQLAGRSSSGQHPPRIEMSSGTIDGCTLLVLMKRKERC